MSHIRFSILCWALLLPLPALAEVFENGELTVGRESMPLTEFGAEVEISPYNQALPYVFAEGGENYSGLIFDFLPKFRYNFGSGCVAVTVPFVHYRLKPGSLIPVGSTSKDLPNETGTALGNPTLRLQFQKVWGEDVGATIGIGLETALPAAGKKALIGSSPNMMKLAQFSPDTFTAMPYLTGGFDLEFLLFEAYSGLLVMVPTKDAGFLSASGKRATELRVDFGGSAIVSPVDFFNVLIEVTGQKGLNGEDKGMMVYLNPGVRFQMLYFKPGFSIQLPLFKPASREAYLSDYGIYADITFGE